MIAYYFILCPINEYRYYKIQDIIYNKKRKMFIRPSVCLPVCWRCLQLLDVWKIGGRSTKAGPNPPEAHIFYFMKTGEILSTNPNENKTKWKVSVVLQFVHKTLRVFFYLQAGESEAFLFYAYWNRNRAFKLSRVWKSPFSVSWNVDITINVLYFCPKNYF